VFRAQLGREHIRFACWGVNMPVGEALPVASCAQIGLTGDGLPLPRKERPKAARLARPALCQIPSPDASIQNGLSRSLISQNFFPKSAPTRRSRGTLRNKRFSTASAPTRTEVDERARAWRWMRATG
jgi:hypothetical protein